MKKNITIILLVLLSSTFLIYAFIKADEAEKANIEAEEQRKNAIELQELAVKHKEQALTVAAEAKRLEAQALELKDALVACQSK